MILILKKTTNELEEVSKILQGLINKINQKIKLTNELA